MRRAGRSAPGEALLAFPVSTAALGQGPDRGGESCIETEVGLGDPWGAPAQVLLHFLDSRKAPRGAVGKPRTGCAHPAALAGPSGVAASPTHGRPEALRASGSVGQGLAARKALQPRRAEEIKPRAAKGGPGLVGEEQAVTLTRETKAEEEL